jgi:hypothetical protein
MLIQQGIQIYKFTNIRVRVSNLISINRTRISDISIVRGTTNRPASMGKASDSICQQYNTGWKVWVSMYSRASDCWSTFEHNVSHRRCSECCAIHCWTRVRRLSIFRSLRSRPGTPIRYKFKPASDHLDIWRCFW